MKQFNLKGESHGQQKLVLVVSLEAKFRVENKFTSNRQPKFARQMEQSRQEGDGMERCDRKFRIKNQESQSLKESQKREALVQQSLLTVTRRDKGRQEELEDRFDAWVLCCDEAEVAQKLKQRFARYKGTWELVEKNTDVVAERAWQLSQSSNTESQQLDFFFFEKLLWTWSENMAGTTTMQR